MRRSEALSLTQRERERQWRDGREGEEVQTLNCQITKLICSQAPWVPMFKLLLSCGSFHHMSYCFLSCPPVSTKKGKKHIAFICNKNIRKENSKSQGQQCVKGRRWGLVRFHPVLLSKWTWWISDSWWRRLREAELFLLGASSQIPQTLYPSLCRV